MTRVCSYCKKILGEKCPECGTDCEFAAVDANGRVHVVCPKQGCAITIFMVGETGASRGVCDVCMVKKGFRQPVGLRIREAG